MTMKRNEKTEKVEVELNEEDLEQVSGGFNPQPDPPGNVYIHFKYNQQLSQPLAPGVQVTVQKVK